MASAMRKMAVYLGLVEGDHRYDDQYQDEYAAEEYEEYGAEFIDAGDPRDLNGHAGDGTDDEGPRPTLPPRRPTDLLGDDNTPIGNWVALKPT